MAFVSAVFDCTVSLHLSAESWLRVVAAFWLFASRLGGTASLHVPQ